MKTLATSQYSWLFQRRGSRALFVLGAALLCTGCGGEELQPLDTDHMVRISDIQQGAGTASNSASNGASAVTAAGGGGTTTGGAAGSTDGGTGTTPATGGTSAGAAAGGSSNNASGGGGTPSTGGGNTGSGDSSSPATPTSETPTTPTGGGGSGSGSYGKTGHITGTAKDGSNVDLIISVDHSRNLSGAGLEVWFTITNKSSTDLPTDLNETLGITLGTSPERSADELQITDVDACPPNPTKPVKEGQSVTLCRHFTIKSDAKIMSGSAAPRGTGSTVMFEYKD